MGNRPWIAAGPPADTFAAELLRHVGMLEGDDIALELVVLGRKISLDLELEAVMGLVVDDVAHVVSGQLFSESVSILRIDQASPSDDPLMSSIRQLPASRTKS